MRSALTNCLHRAYFGRNLHAKVVFPEPLGPATMYKEGDLLPSLEAIRQPHRSLVVIDRSCPWFSLFR